nr:MAG TPA: hypothetical protein [Caudoviricetes sp.]
MKKWNMMKRLVILNLLIKTMRISIRVSLLSVAEIIMRLRRISNGTCRFIGSCRFKRAEEIGFN